MHQLPGTSARNTLTPPSSYSSMTISVCRKAGWHVCWHPSPIRPLSGRAAASWRGGRLGGPAGSLRSLTGWWELPSAECQLRGARSATCGRRIWPYVQTYSRRSAASGPDSEKSVTTHAQKTQICVSAWRPMRQEPNGCMRPTRRARHHVPVSRTSFSFFLRRNYLEGRGKLEMARLLGHEKLQNERDYLCRTLPSGIFAGLWAAARHGDINGLFKAGAIVAGIIAAAVGAAVGVRGLAGEQWVSDAYRLTSGDTDATYRSK